MPKDSPNILYGNRIDIHNIRNRFSVAVENLKTNKKISNRNRDFILKFLRDAELGKTIRKRQKKKIGPARLHKYIGVLKTLDSWLGKDYDKASEEDMERIILALEKDDYMSKKGKPFSDETKVDFKKMIKKFYKWLFGNDDQYPEIVAWFDTSLREKEIPALTKEEVEKLVEHSPNLLIKTAIMVLFDSGARIEEFLNIRLKHLTRKDDYYMIMIEYSKTKPRPISLPLCTKLLDELLEEQRLNDPEAQVFPLGYDAFRIMLSRLGRKALKKHVNPHLLRHSSATYYAGIENNYFRFCKRYGWTFGSKMAQRYIDRAGIQEEQTANAVKIDEISKVKSENQKIQEDLKNLKAECDEMYNRQEKLSRLMLTFIKEGGIKTYSKTLGKEGLVKDYLEATKGQIPQIMVGEKP